jgi:hypothetical protein
MEGVGSVEVRGGREGSCCCDLVDERRSGALVFIPRGMNRAIDDASWSF